MMRDGIHLSVSHYFFILRKYAPVDKRVIKALKEHAYDFKEENIFGTACYTWWDLDYELGTEVFGDPDEEPDEEFDRDTYKIFKKRAEGYWELLDKLEKNKQLYSANLSL